MAGWEVKTVLCGTVRKEGEDALKGEDTGAADFVFAARHQKQWLPMEKVCNTLGAEGWELVGSTPIDKVDNYKIYQFHLLFKRPKL